MRKRFIVIAGLLGGMLYMLLHRRRTYKTISDKALPMDDLEPSRHLRLMTYNLLAGYKAWGGSPVKPRAFQMQQVCEKLQPDLLCVQEMDQSWYYYLRHLPARYRTIAPVKTGMFVYMTSLIYNHEVLSLEAYGNRAYQQGRLKRTRRMAYGVFRVKADGRRFAVISTHFSLVFPGHERSDLRIMRQQAKELVAFIKELQATYQCGVIIAGDFNCKEPYAHASVYDACEIYQYLSTHLIDVCDRCGYYKRPTRDHIFMTEMIDAHAVHYEMRPAFQMISDHYPMIFDFE